MVKASDIMMKEVITVTPETPVEIAIKLLVIRKLTGLPVLDDNKEVLGIISEKDIMCLLINNENFKEKKVSEFMTRNVQCFQPTDDANTICEFLLANTFRRVPIVENKKLVGIISRRDIISLIWENHVNSK